MLKSIAGCHFLIVFPGTMPDEGSQVGFVSLLTTTNLAILTNDFCFRTEVKAPELTVSAASEVWQVGDVSITLSLLWLVVIRMGAQ